MNKMTKVKVGGIECPRCKEQIWSRYRHDFRFCGCGYSHVDGGRDYLKYGWGVPAPKSHDDMTKKDWDKMNKENEKLGIPAMIDIEVNIDSKGVYHELPQQRDRVEASSVRPVVRGSRKSPSKPVRRGANKATVR